MKTLSERLREEQLRLKQSYGQGYSSTQKLLLEAADELEKNTTVTASDVGAVCKSTSCYFRYKTKEMDAELINFLKGK